MPDLPRGEGERREAATRRKRILVIGALFVVGLVSGFYTGFQEGAAFFGADGRWPPAMSLVLIALFLGALVFGSLVLNKVMDEVDRQLTYKAASFASMTLLVAYPIWFLLWKGGFVGVPVHWAMYAAFVVALLLAAGWYRFR